MASGPVQTAACLLARLREVKPLLHHITNHVVMNLTANATLALGALPVMAHSTDEAGDMASSSDALVLNMGTPDRDIVDAMVIAGKSANRKGIPVVFDPVGAGATPYRSQVAKKILAEVEVDLLRGNAAELASVIGCAAEVRGVEAGGQEVDPAEMAPLAARRLGLTVVVTGPTDYVSDGRVLGAVSNGHPLMARITGSGCTCTAAVAAFCAVERDFPVAAASALACLGAAAQLAAERSDGPGSFQVNWLDELHRLTPETLSGMARIEWKDAARRRERL